MQEVEDPLKELFVGMIQDAKNALELFVVQSPLIKFDGKASTFKPLLLTIGWLADPDKSGAFGVTFGQCCDYLNIQKDVVMKNFKEILSHADPRGVRELHRHIGAVLSSPHLFREHYKHPRRKDKASR